jgi:hypothetical protein
MFLGWSTNKRATVPDIDNYGESTSFSYSSMQTPTLHLYAVWTFYTFSGNDTSITIQNSGN